MALEDGTPSASKGGLQSPSVSVMPRSIPSASGTSRLKSPSSEKELAAGSKDLTDEHNVLALECFLLTLTEARDEPLLDADKVELCGLNRNFVTPGHGGKRQPLSQSGRNITAMRGAARASFGTQC